MPTILPEPTLFREVAVHCFWHPRCAHIVRELDPHTAHDLMEQHYSAKHRADIDKIILSETGARRPRTA